MTEKTFGTEMTVAGLTLRGPIDRDHELAIPAAIELVQAIVDCIGMTCSHPAQVTDYPVDAIEGCSPGFLITQPIISSAILLDVWPPHQCLYVHAISCKDFQPDALWQLFRDRGFVVRDTFGGYLGL